MKFLSLAGIVVPFFIAQGVFASEVTSKEILKNEQHSVMERQMNRPGKLQLPLDSVTLSYDHKNKEGTLCYHDDLEPISSKDRPAQRDAYRTSKKPHYPKKNTSFVEEAYISPSIYSEVGAYFHDIPSIFFDEC